MPPVRVSRTTAVTAFACQSLSVFAISFCTSDWMPLSSVSCTVLPGTGSRTCSTRAQCVSPVGRSLTLDTDARPSRALSSLLRVSSTPEIPEPSTPTTWAARPPRGYERRGSLCGSIARASTSGPSTGSFVILVHIEGSRRRAANTNCALPPMRCSIVAGVTSAYCESACANARRSGTRAGHTPTVTAR